jgi:hypothetical protein
MDTSNHKEFRVSNDGSFVAVGSVDKDVCVIRVADNRRYDLPGVSYDFGGHRLAVDPQSGTLFSGAYHNTGIAAYEIETGNRLWHRRDLKKVQEIAYDSRHAVVYCAFKGRAAKPLNARDGRERRSIRGLEGFHFSKDSSVGVFELDDVRLENRVAGATHILPRQSWGVLDVAFAAKAVVLSWVGGPVVSYNAQTGEELWRYATEGTHAFSIAPSSDETAVWVAEQPYKEPPWHRLRLISSAGQVIREIRCALGHSFEILPFCDKVIRTDVEIVAIDSLAPQLTTGRS